MNELCFCPFCGHGAPAVYLSGAEPRYYVHCESCGAFGPVAATKERAKHAWNISNDKAAMLAALVNVLQTSPVLANWLNEKRGSRATWKMAQELCR